MTDIHGDHKGMMKLFEHVKFNPSTEQIVICGDMIDRGKESGQVLKEIYETQEKYPSNVLAVTGNHEEMMKWYTVGHDVPEEEGMWMIHGGIGTQASFNTAFRNNDVRNKIIKWACSLPIIIEDDEFVYTHAGIDPSCPLNEQSRDVIWMNEGTFYAYDRDLLLAVTGGKPIIHGHTPVEYMYFDGARLNCDLGSQSYEIVEERGLALVNLTEQIYYVYKSHTKTIEKRSIVDITKDRY
jgi:serine/threonine protein phosphatase 1